MKYLIEYLKMFLPPALVVELAVVLIHFTYGAAWDVSLGTLICLCVIYFGYLVRRELFEIEHPRICRRCANSRSTK